MTEYYVEYEIDPKIDDVAVWKYARQKARFFYELDTNNKAKALTVSKIIKTVSKIGKLKRIKFEKRG